MESIHEMAVQWVVVVTLTITPAKGPEQSMELGRAPVRDLVACNFVGNFSKSLYDDFRAHLKRKRKRFKHIRRFRVTHVCAPFVHGA